MTEHAALDLTDRVIIVTGASSGIGEAAARLLHQSGARPVLAAAEECSATAPPHAAAWSSTVLSTSGG